MYPHVMPDGGKFQRAIEDALTGTVWKDDAQVVQWHGAKVYPGSGTLPEPGVVIRIWPLQLTYGGEL
jgi:Holliday junction resolvase RusA-like endonuclease